MSENKVNDNKQISFRMSEDLYNKLAAYAKASNLSLNAVTIQAVQKLLESDDIKRRLVDLEMEVQRLRSKIQ